MVHEEPVIVTASGAPYYWVGPVGADDLAESEHDRREWRAWNLDRW